MVIPVASTNSATRKVTNSPDDEAGTNSKQPAVISSRPIAAVLMYPTLRTIAAAGKDTAK